MHQEPSSQLQHGQHNLLVLLLCLYPPVPHQSIVSVNMDLHAQLQLITIKTDKVLSTLFRYLCCLNSKACLATIQIDNINTRIILAYIFASTKAMEGNE